MDIIATRIEPDGNCRTFRPPHALAVRTICDLQKAEGAKGHGFAGCGIVIENEDHQVMVRVPFDAR